MLLTMMKGKLHRATVTDSNKEYAGSIAIDEDLMKQANIIVHEQVDVYNITNGERFTTYAIKAEGGSGTIGIKGAAAHRAKIGDLIIICAYVQMDKEEALEHKPSVVVLDQYNKKMSDIGCQMSGGTTDD